MARGRTAALAALVCSAAAAGAGCGDNLVHPTWWHDSPRMRVRAWATVPGYRYVFGWRDQMLDVVCDTDAPACAPLVSAYFADASCRDLIAASPGELPAIAMYRDSRGGHGVVIDAPFQGVLYFRRGGCTLAGPTDPNIHYAHARLYNEVLLPEIEERAGGARYHFPDLAYVALADAAAIEEAEANLDILIEEGPGRLRTRYLLDGDVALAAGIHDADHDVPCTPRLDVAGELRCLPELEVALYPAGVAFSDAACAQPIDAAVFATAGFTAAGDGYARVDTPVPGPVYVLSGGTCVATSMITLWRAGAALPATAFEPMFVEEVARP